MASFLISTMVVLIVPRLVGVTEYGYWQLYLFYSSYVGFMHFGWSDGIYLRYGGRKYEDLNKTLFFSQFYMFIAQQLIFAVLIWIAATFVISDGNRLFILQMTALCLLMVNVRTMPLFILQATNRIKEYAKVTIVGKILYFAIMVVVIALGVREFRLMIYADLIGKAFSLAYAVYYTRDIACRKLSDFCLNFSEVFKNTGVGIRLMLANIASTLIIGTVRFGIERAWDVATFGKVSLTLSVSNLLMLFINAVGVILFPILRRTDQRNLPRIYTTMRDLLMILLFGVLVTYYPLRVVLSAWLPQYKDSLIYMALVFPMSIYEGKKALLINTYLKTLRQEKLMFTINLISLIMSVLITFMTTVLFRDLNLAILSIVVVLAFRAILAEVYLSRILSLPLVRDVILELVVVTAFILTGWYIDSWLSTLVYTGVYVVYLAIKFSDIKITSRNVKALLRA
jgi:O-antigen/teichoic acid export membrane protein